MTAYEEVVAGSVTHCAGVAGCGSNLEIVAAGVALGATIVVGHIAWQIAGGGWGL